MPAVTSSTTATGSHLPLHHHTNIHSIADAEQRRPGPSHPRDKRVKPRAGKTVSVAGQHLKGPLFIRLCIVCAYPSTPVLSGLWRTCGLKRGAATSLQIRVVHDQWIRVEKNLSGVSAQVTAPGVLAFGHIFAELRGG